jgi:hypothetical protein
MVTLDNPYKGNIREVARITSRELPEHFASDLASNGARVHRSSTTLHQPPKHVTRFSCSTVCVRTNHISRIYLTNLTSLRRTIPIRKETTHSFQCASCLSFDKLFEISICRSWSSAQEEERGRDCIRAGGGSEETGSGEKMVSKMRCGESATISSLQGVQKVRTHLQTYRPCPG